MHLNIVILRAYIQFEPVFLWCPQFGRAKSKALVTPALGRPQGPCAERRKARPQSGGQWRVLGAALPIWLEAVGLGGGVSWASCAPGPALGCPGSHPSHPGEGAAAPGEPAAEGGGRAAPQAEGGGGQAAAAGGVEAVSAQLPAPVQPGPRRAP